MDIYGADTDREWYRRRERSEDNGRKPYDNYRSSTEPRHYNVENRHRRRYSPPEQNSRQHGLARSNSHHNIRQSPKQYVQELRFP